MARLLNRVIIPVSIAILMICEMTSAAYFTVDVRSLTVPATALTDLDLPPIVSPPSLLILPFYLQVNYSKENNMNWGIELYTRNSGLVDSQTPSNGIYRGLRGITDINHAAPLYWQVYDYDHNVAATWGTPNSVTTTPGGLGFYNNTLRYWGLVYDNSDIDREATWDDDRFIRTAVSVEGLGNYPFENRENENSAVYIYMGADFTNPSTVTHKANLRLDFFTYPFDFNTGCYVTPNPVKPVLGQKAYFNFYTNSPDSKITIKIFDPTGFPVVTLRNTRYWDCRNSNAQYVEGGLYLYQIETEGHRISGTVVVVK